MTRPRSSDAERDLSDSTLAVWERRAGRELSEEDLREIRVNLSGFMEVLLAWKRAADAKSKDQVPSSGETPGKTQGVPR